MQTHEFVCIYAREMYKNTHSRKNHNTVIGGPKNSPKI